MFRVGLWVLISFCLTQKGICQYTYSVQLQDSISDQGIENVIILDSDGDYLSETDEKGKATITNAKSKLSVKLININYDSKYVDLLPIDAERVSYLIYLKPKESILQEVIVMGSKAIKNISESQIRSTTILRRDRSESLLPTANTAEDLLAQLSATQSILDPINGNSVGANGQGGTNVKLLLDGQPVAGRMNGNIDMSQFSLYNIQAVQVYFGPQSIIYGSDAGGGLVNLISFGKTSKKVAGSLQAYYETLNRYNVDASVDFNTRNNNFGISLGRYYFDGMSFYDSLERKKNWLPKEQYFLNLKWGHRWDIGDNKLLAQWRTDLYKEKLYNPGEPTVSVTQGEATSFDDEYDTDRINSSLGLNLWGKVWTHNLQNSYSLFERNTKTYFLDFVEGSKTEIKNNPNQDKFDLLQSRYIAQKKSDKIGLQLGTDLNRESGQGSKMTTRQSRYELGLFGLLNYKLHKWDIIPGLRYNVYSRNTNQFIPALQVSVKPSKKTYIEFGYTKAYRVPTLKEMYMEFVDVNHNIIGNENLLPESTHSLNAGVKINLKDDESLWDVKYSTAYYTTENQILLTSILNTQNSFTYSNIGDVESSSQILELNFSQKKNNNNIISLKASTNWIHYFRYGTITHKDAYAHSFFVTWKYPRWKTSLSLSSKTSIDQRTFVVDVDTIIDRSLENYTLMNIGLSRPFCKESLVLELGVKNIFDVTQVAFKDGLGSVGVGGSVHGTTGSSVMSGAGRALYFRVFWNW